MTSLPIADAKARLSELISEVAGTHERVQITRHGQPQAILISPDDLESLEETLAVLSDAALREQLEGSRADVEAGRVFDGGELFSALDERRRTPDSR